MNSAQPARLHRLLALTAALLVLKVNANVVLGYRDYFPPNFSSEFFFGRESYFAGGYRWAFYSHIAAGPATLVFGLILVSDRIRARFPAWHRALGKAQLALVLLLIVPSGLWMSWYVMTGKVAGAGFAMLALATGVSAVCGWRAAVQRRFIDHRRWMRRCFLLLCSAVVLRLIGGLTVITEIRGDRAYRLAAWVSWLVPLLSLELWDYFRRRARRSVASAADYFEPSAATESSPAIDVMARR